VMAVSPSNHDTTTIVVSMWTSPYIELPRHGHISAVVYASGHPVSTRHLQLRVGII
jgi:hypothetical protein